MITILCKAYVRFSLREKKMGLKYLHLKHKVFRLKQFMLGRGGGGGRRRRKLMPAKKASWVMPITHGYYVVEHHMIRDCSEDSEPDFDSIVVQREQMDQTELWYFGISDAVVGDGVTKYLQSNLFDKKLQESDIRKKGKETLKRAYLSARAKIREESESDEAFRMSSTSVLVINGQKLVIANMGDYRAVLCKDGVPHLASGRHQLFAKRHWSRRLFPVHILGCESGNAASRGSEVVIKVERIDSYTEFLILASNGIWEVMKGQEAVNLISHIQDPQEAAECLAREAINRMSKRNISCLVIRFDS